MTTQKYLKIKQCIKCNVKLKENVNWFKRKSRNYICNNCDWKSAKPRMQEYIYVHKEKNEWKYNGKWAKIKSKINRGII